MRLRLGLRLQLCLGLRLWLRLGLLLRPRLWCLGRLRTRLWRAATRTRLRRRWILWVRLLRRSRAETIEGGLTGFTDEHRAILWGDRQHVKR